MDPDPHGADKKRLTWKRGPCDGHSSVWNLRNHPNIKRLDLLVACRDK